MKPAVFAAFLVMLITASACTQSYYQAPTQTPTALPQPTETTVPPTFTPQPSPTSIPKPTVELHRGVNMGNMLEAPNEGDWGLYVQQEYFDLIKQAGFDFVRLPVSWDAHAELAEPYTIDPEFFFRADQVIEWATERDLTIILDFHNYDEMMSNPWGNEERFVAIWKQISEHYKDYPANVLFELLNEPNTQLDAQLWNQYLMRTLAVIRETNPTRDIVIGPTQWNSYGWISTLDVPNDPHILATFHYYEPFHFTHQGAEWVDESSPWLGTTWDATDEQKAEVTSNFDSVAEWSKRHGSVRILLGEFGAYSKAPQDSRVRWTTFIREQAEAHGFAWAYWEFGAGFGVYDPNVKVWRADLLKALIP